MVNTLKQKKKRERKEKKVKNSWVRKRGSEERGGIHSLLVGCFLQLSGTGPPSLRLADARATGELEKCV